MKRVSGPGLNPTSYQLACASSNLIWPFILTLIFVKTEIETLLCADILYKHQNNNNKILLSYVYN